MWMLIHFFSFDFGAATAAYPLPWETVRCSPDMAAWLLLLVDDVLELVSGGGSGSGGSGLIGPCGPGSLRIGLEHTQTDF